MAAVPKRKRQESVVPHLSREVRRGAVSTTLTSSPRSSAVTSAVPPTRSSVRPSAGAAGTSPTTSPMPNGENFILLSPADELLAGRGPGKSSHSIGKSHSAHGDRNRKVSAGSSGGFSRAESLALIDALRPEAAVLFCFELQDCKVELLAHESRYFVLVTGAAPAELFLFELTSYAQGHNTFLCGNSEIAVQFLYRSVSLGMAQLSLSRKIRKLLFGPRIDETISFELVITPRERLIRIESSLLARPALVAVG